MIHAMSMTLDDVRAELLAWKGIAIAKSSNPVPGDGNPDAEIVFIGEAPGAQEDKQGRPFVGNSGKLLAELLATIGLSREDVYITNVVKFRPPDNRDPTAKEKEACMPFLRDELSIIKPKVIVPLGRHALSHFTKDSTIGEAHGHPLPTTEDYAVFPMYHPAAALHNPGLRKTLKDDFAALGAFLEQCPARQ
jgi:uracil-DNA glycosylase family 4